jgi:creatinine amidohydrolase
MTYLGASPDHRHELLLERLTWPEVAARLEDGFRTVVAACGSTEQHGPHLPLMVDAARGTRLAVEVAVRLGKALVAPTIAVGCSGHHMEFPGTLSLRESTFSGICQDYCTSLARHGIRRVCLVPTHGGNFPVLERILAWLNEAAGAECEVLAFLDVFAVLQIWRRVVEEETGLGARVGGHADIAESSIFLAIHPDLVHGERVESGYLPALNWEAIGPILARGLHTVTPNGILGDARGMNARIGERCIAEVADLMADHFRRTTTLGTPESTDRSDAT